MITFIFCISVSLLLRLTVGIEKMETDMSKEKLNFVLASEGRIAVSAGKRNVHKIEYIRADKICVARLPKTFSIKFPIGT
jgi:hypothetical protein